MKYLQTIVYGFLLVGQCPLSAIGTDYLAEKSLLSRMKKNGRDYAKRVSKAEKKDLSDIVKALAYDSWTSLMGNKSSLNAKGKNIESVHPFRFLETVFRNEELKAGIHAIRDRGGLFWNDFIKGLTRSLDEEANQQNLLPFTSEFANNIHFSEARMLPYLQQKKWTDFVNLLIDEIPREISPDRYDM